MFYHNRKFIMKKNQRLRMLREKYLEFIPPIRDYLEGEKTAEELITINNYNPESLKKIIEYLKSPQNSLFTYSAGVGLRYRPKYKNIASIFRKDKIKTENNPYLRVCLLIEAIDKILPFHKEYIISIEFRNAINS